MENLMALVGEGERLTQINEKAQKALEKSQQLLDLGFQDLAISIKEKAQREARLNALIKYNYICLTQKKIQKFLNNKAAAYNKDHAKAEFKKNPLSYFQRQSDSAATTSAAFWVSSGQSTILGGVPAGFGLQPQMGDDILGANTMHAMTDKPGTIGRFLWTETSIDKYRTLPPDSVLETFKEHKARNVFDYFTIASVNEIKDPLLLGRIHGSQDRFFIAQWGDDVALDEVI